MTEEQIKELERLAAQATPGPWSHEPDENFLDHDCQIIKGDTAFVCEFVTEKNAAYIVAACNMLPDFIAENRALQERVRELERQRKLMADGLELYCNYVHREDGDCPFWIKCPNGRLCTGEVSDKMWIEFFEREAAKETGE